MKYYEIIGVRSNDKIVERFFENGKRFIKYIPFNPKIVTALKEQFKDKPMEVELTNGWIVLTKTGYDEQMADAARKVTQKEELTIEDLAETEMKMLKSAGYKVSLNMGEIEDG